MDIEPDRKSGRATSATILGKMKTKSVIIGVVLAETLLIWLHFGDGIFAAGLGLFLIWLLLDISILYAEKEYTMKEFTIFGIGSNAVALLSMIYVWQAQVFAS